MLTQFQSDDRVMQMMQNSWASALDPIISNPANQSILLKNVSLVNGLTVVNHRLGRKLQGWKIVRLRAAASIYDTQDVNQHQDLTLYLNSNANVIVDLEVF